MPNVHKGLLMTTTGLWSGHYIYHVQYLIMLCEIIQGMIIMGITVVNAFQTICHNVIWILLFPCMGESDCLYVYKSLLYDILGVLSCYPLMTASRQIHSRIIVCLKPRGKTLCVDPLNKFIMQIVTFHWVCFIQ